MTYANGSTRCDHFMLWLTNNTPFFLEERVVKMQYGCEQKFPLLDFVSHEINWNYFPVSSENFTNGVYEISHKHHKLYELYKSAEYYSCKLFWKP